MIIWPTLLLVSLVSIWLSVIDAKTMLIPNRIVLPATALALGLAFLGSLEIGLRSLMAALVAYLTFVLLNLVSRGQVGMGDAKLGALLAAGLGSISWGAVLLGLSFGFVFGGVAAAVKLIAGRGKNLRSSFAYGPYLTAGAIAVFALNLLAS